MCWRQEIILNQIMCVISSVMLLVISHFSNFNDDEIWVNLILSRYDINSYTKLCIRIIIITEHEKQLVKYATFNFIRRQSIVLCVPASNNRSVVITYLWYYNYPVSHLQFGCTLQLFHLYLLYICHEKRVNYSYKL